MWWIHAYHWLEANNLWQTAIAWVMFTSFTAALAWFPWKRHKKTQDKIADSLDTSTPGGLTAVVESLNKLGEEESSGADHS